jgi:hypothetical protein
MNSASLLIELLACGFFFVLGWLVGIERNNYLTKELTFWKAYTKELEKNKNNGTTKNKGKG